jgi:hypothetical protein
VSSLRDDLLNNKKKLLGGALTQFSQTTGVSLTKVGIWTTSLAILTPKPVLGLVKECADRVQRKNRQASAQRPERQKTEEGTDVLENV